MILDDNFIFRNGKYAGKTFGFVKQNNPSYIDWARANAPNLLKEYKKKESSETSTEKIKPTEYLKGSRSAIQPNLDFYNEKK
jgi:hypothetical protein